MNYIPIHIIHIPYKSYQYTHLLIGIRPFSLSYRYMHYFVQTHFVGFGNFALKIIVYTLTSIGSDPSVNHAIGPPLILMFGTAYVLREHLTL